MKIALLAVVAVALSACASVQAEKADGKRYTCVPNSAMDRGPFQPTPTPGTALTVSGKTAEVVAGK